MRSGEYWICGCEHDNRHELTEHECPRCGWYMDEVEDEIEQLVEDIVLLEKQRAKKWNRLKRLLERQAYRPKPLWQKLVEVIIK